MSRRQRQQELPEVAATVGRAPDYTWNKLPVYRCGWCGDHYERVDNLDAVLAHEREQHGAVVRPSAILGADGEPMQVEEKELDHV